MPNRGLSDETKALLKQGGIPRARVQAYERLLDRIEKELLTHDVIANNRYTRWFKEGRFDREDLRHFLVQFSVFSNLFIEAQLKKVINAPTLEAMHASKEILMNELGVVFRKPGAKTAAAKDVDAELVGTEGTVDGGMFRFPAAHFEWLLRMISHVGLAYEDVGKRRHGSPSTLFFCDELSRLYGSDDPHVGLGASFAVENWAAAGFWKELVQGLEAYKKREKSKMPIAFFTWHDRVEDQHAAHTWTELEEDFFSTEVDEDKFIRSGREMLDGVQAFWTGLNDARLQRDGVRKTG
ncbi:MAG: hypothetical protein HY293_02850 [Planctomycetes bacterium]|nr:hypothetical protein [Planctomycetota bacterium]